MAHNINFSGRQVAVKTLTVRQVKELLVTFKELSENPADLTTIDVLFNDDIPAIAVVKATGLSMEELEADIHPQEVMDLIDAVRAENPFFVGMMERMVAAGRQMGGQSSSQSAP